MRRLWPQVLEEVKNRRRFTWILLSQNAQVTDVRDGTLLLSLANVGARDSFGKGGSEDILREALIAALGVDLAGSRRWSTRECREFGIDQCGGAGTRGFPAPGGSGWSRKCGW